MIDRLFGFLRTVPKHWIKLAFSSEICLEFYELYVFFFACKHCLRMGKFRDKTSRFREWNTTCFCEFIKFAPRYQRKTLQLVLLLLFVCCFNGSLCFISHCLSHETQYIVNVWWHVFWEREGKKRQHSTGCSLIEYKRVSSDESRSQRVCEFEYII